MRAVKLYDNVDLETAASQTEIDLSDGDLFPLLAGAPAVAVIETTVAPGTAVVLEGREAASGAYTALATVPAADAVGTFFFNIDRLPQEIRVTVTGTAAAAGVANVHLLSN